MSHQIGGFLGRIGFTGSTQPKELDYIKAALAQFQTANETALALKLLCQLALRESGFCAECNNRLANAFALTGIKANRADGHGSRLELVSAVGVRGNVKMCRKAVRPNRYGLSTLPALGFPSLVQARGVRHRKPL